jgi:putative oxidoreductase
MIESAIVARWKSVTPQLQGLLRIIAAFLFMQPGAMKLFGFPVSMPPGMEVAFLSQAYVGGVLELYGGALILVGLWVRPVAFVLAGEMAVAYFQFHASAGFWPLANRGTEAILFCFTWLYFSAAGAGAFSLEARRKA